MLRKVVAFTVCAACVTLALVVIVPRVGRVEAHAAYASSIPADGAVVPIAPAIVEVIFTQEIDASGTVLRVVGPDGEQIAQGDTALDLDDPNRKRVTVSLRRGLESGEYTVEWTTLSREDGESDSGAFSFTVTDGSDGIPIGSPAASLVASPAATPSA